MHKRLSNSTPSHREQWLALLENQGVGRPKALSVVEVPGGLVQATIGEAPGRISLDGAPGSVLMFNISPVQGLRQTREGRSFVSDMLHGEMTLMPRGVPSQWSGIPPATGWMSSSIRTCLATVANSTLSIATFSGIRKWRRSADISTRNSLSAACPSDSMWNHS